MRLLRSVLLVCLSAACAVAQWNPANPVTAVKREAGGVLLSLQSGAAMRLALCNDSMIRVTYSPTATFPNLPEYVIAKNSWPEAKWTYGATDAEVTVATARMRVVVTRKDGVITYYDLAGKKLFNEGPRSLTPVKVNGENTYKAESFVAIWGSPEAFYGLGQHQAGVWNYRGESVDVAQDNTSIALPLLVSSNGYGVFWNNTSRTKFNNRFLHALYITSEVADAIDYYFVYGPDFDRIVAAYRDLTGPAPLFGKWAYGFWQCKNKYQSQQELLGVAHKYRELRIPIDSIVQDWFWWNRKGEHIFNKNYPDPKGMVDDLHRNNFHLMISVWPFFDRGSKEYETMDKNGWLVDRTKVAGFHPEGMAVYDATSPDARKYYWQLMNQALFRIGVDAWWLDTVEPETEGREDNILIDHKLAIGSGNRYANLYPLMTTSGVYEGQRAASDQKRVFILSRSAFAGIQRNAVTVWSGDVNSDFESFRRQIPAALNFTLSGVPYWTSDIGGFVPVETRNPEYRELFVRWFQFGAFCPIFRVHGTRIPDENEIWSYGPEAQKILTAYDRLRYELLPYIYSLAWKVTGDKYTIMRPLMMDFASDPRVKNIGDQYMFGPAFLVSPVTEQGATTRRVYLPKGAWYDFWSGRTVTGGAAIDAAAPLDRLPLYVRAGSIVPFGPDLQFATEKPADPIELRVYRGADGAFTLYEDENDNYNYEKGAYATIPMTWDETKQTLTIGARKGQFPGMLAKRTFRVVFVDEGRGVGIGQGQAGKTIEYAGSEISVTR